MKDRRSYASKRNYVCMIISWKHLCTLNSTCAYLCEKVPGGSQHSGWALPRPPPPGAGLPEPQGLLPETRASSLCKQRQDNNWFTPENKHREINFNQVMLYFLLLYMIGALAQDRIRLENTPSFSFASQSNIYPFQTISQVSHDVGKINKI